MTQDDLAAAVGKHIHADAPSQALISKIESGQIESSDMVVPICEVLGIAFPEHFVNEDDRNWVQLGRVLRSKNMDKYKKWLSLLEDEVEPEKPAATEPEVIPTKPPERK